MDIDIDFGWRSKLGISVDDGEATGRYVRDKLSFGDGRDDARGKGVIKRREKGLG